MKPLISITKQINKFSKFLIYTGILALILGFFAIAYPSSFGMFSAVVIGVFLILGGVIRLPFAIMSFSIGSVFLKYLYALLMIIAGIWIILNPDISLSLLTMIMAVYFIIDGITEIAYSTSLIPIGGGLYFLFSGIIGIIIGGLIITKWPESSNYALGIYLGIKFITDGLMLSLTGITIKKNKLKSKKPTV